MDFKTGTSVVTKNDIKLNPQVNIYAAAAGEKYDSLPAKVSLVYLGKEQYDPGIRGDRGIAGGWP